MVGSPTYMPDFGARFNGGVLSGQPAAPQGALGGGGFLQTLLDPQVALPMAAALMGGRNATESIGGAFQAAGPGIVASRKRMLWNSWLKAGAPKDPNHPALRALIAESPEVQDKLLASKLSAPSTDGMTSTVHVYDAEKGITKVMQFDPATGQYDKEVGIAPPASGMSIETMPDGTMRLLQGEGVTATGGKLPLGRTASNDVQKEIAPLEMQKQQIEHIGDLYSPDFLTYKGKARTAINRFIDKTGFSGPEGKAQLAGATKFKQNVEQIFNAYRKDITGAAASVGELERLKQAVINTDQSPTEFEAAMGEFAQALQRGLDIKKSLLDQGIPLGSTQFSKAFEQQFLGGGGQPAAAPAAPAQVAPQGAVTHTWDPQNGLRQIGQ